MNLMRLLQSLHGYLAVLAVAALVHPAILLRHGKPLTRRNKWAVALSTTLSVAVFSSGWYIYPDYRREVKRHLFTDSILAGLLFETKEHIAVTVVALAVGGGVAAWLAPRRAVALRKTAAMFYAWATVCILTVIGLGAYIASVRSF